VIIFKVTAETKTAISTALRGHAGDASITLGVGKRDIRENAPVVVAHIIDVWPGESDETYRVALNDNAGLIAYRALMRAEIVAGRGLKRDEEQYETTLGVEFCDARDYVKALGKGHGFRPVSGEKWSVGAEWVSVDGNRPDPRQKWARSAWRIRARAHEHSVDAGLAVAGRNTWRPRATMLWLEPVKFVAPEVLTKADLAALEALDA
jgi:hypothetical protein